MEFHIYWIYQSYLQVAASFQYQIYFTFINSREGRWPTKGKHDHISR